MNLALIIDEIDLLINIRVLPYDRLFLFRPVCVPSPLASTLVVYRARA